MMTRTTRTAPTPRRDEAMRFSPNWITKMTTTTKRLKGHPKPSRGRRRGPTEARRGAAGRVAADGSPRGGLASTLAVPGAAAGGNRRTRRTRRRRRHRRHRTRTAGARCRRRRSADSGVAAGTSPPARRLPERCAWNWTLGGGVRPGAGWNGRGDAVACGEHGVSFWGSCRALHSPCETCGRESSHVRPLGAF